MALPLHCWILAAIFKQLGQNPMVGATVAVAVSVEEAANAGKF